MLRKIFPPAFILLLFLPSLTYSQHQPTDTVVIGGVGDIMTGTSFPSEKYLPPDGGKGLFLPVRQMLTYPLLMTGNLEGCYLDSGDVVKKCQDPAKCYAFRMPESHATLLAGAGFDVVSLANNHSGDFGLRGRIRTMALLDSLGIAYAGLQTCPVAIIEKDGLRFGFCAVSPFTGSVDILRYDTVREIIRTLDSLCDIVIVSFHAGAEGAAHRNVTRATEIFYDEDRGNVYEFAHMAVDAGADILFGHGPHVTRAAELYRCRIIFYSLGNFCTYARFNLKGPNGFAPLVHIYTDRRGQFLKARVISIKQIGEGGPLVDPLQQAYREMEELSKRDFPENKLIFGEEGWIFPAE